MHPRHYTALLLVLLSLTACNAPLLTSTPSERPHFDEPAAQAVLDPLLAELARQHRVTDVARIIFFVEPANALAPSITRATLNPPGAPTEIICLSSSSDFPNAKLGRAIVELRSTSTCHIFLLALTENQWVALEMQVNQPNPVLRLAAPPPAR